MLCRFAGRLGISVARNEATEPSPISISRKSLGRRDDSTLGRGAGRDAMLPDDGRCVLPPAEPDCGLLRLGRELGPPIDEPGRDGWRRGNGDGFDGISPNGSSSSRPENAFTASLGAWGRATVPLLPFLLFIFDAISALLNSSLSGYHSLHANHAAFRQSP